VNTTKQEQARLLFWASPFSVQPVVAVSSPFFGLNQRFQIVIIWLLVGLDASAVLDPFLQIW
jgi:hypothetical protein